MSNLLRSKSDGSKKRFWSGGWGGRVGPSWQENWARPKLGDGGVCGSGYAAARQCARDYTAGVDVAKIMLR